MSGSGNVMQVEITGRVHVRHGRRNVLSLTPARNPDEAAEYVERFMFELNRNLKQSIKKAR